MATHGKIGQFDATQETWDAYVERLELYFVANDVKEAEKKRAVLLTVCGPATYRLIRNLVAPQKPAEVAYAELVALVQAHHTPKPSVTVQRFKFHSRTRQPGESVATFIAELRQLTEHCDFGGTLDDMLRDRLVCGIANNSIQRRLLAEPDLTLKKALELARAMETADKDVKDLQGPKSLGIATEVHAVTHKRAGSASSVETPCHRCGRKHSPHDCRHKSTVCHSCKKRGHLARMCRTRSASQGRHNSLRDRPQKTHSVEAEEAESYTLYPVKSPRTPPIDVKVRVNNVDVMMELDTGASVTIISEQTYRKIWPQGAPPLQPSTTRLRTYTGEELEVLGSIHTRVEYKGQRENLPLLVVGGGGPSLLGRNWLQKLKLDWQEIRQLQQTETLQGLMQRHADVFKEELGELEGVKAKISVDPQAQPRFHKPRPIPFALKERVDQELERLEKEGIIESVKFAEWAAPIVPVVKSDGSVRICGDYRLTVNRVSKLDAYPLPKVDELFASLAGGKTFSKLDLQHAYQQLVLDDSSKPYTTINTHRGLFQYKRLPFGISSAPGIFQRTMDSLLQGLPQVAVYMDDILITGETEHQHMQNLDTVLQRLETAGLRLKKSKCIFMASEVEYLGHKINSDGLHPTADKIKAIQEAPKPESVTELKSFLGLLSYYSKFLPNMSTTLAPLYSLLQKGNRWVWGRKQQEAFEAAKALLQSNTLLVHYDPKKELVLACDASPYGVGAVLSHRMADGTEKPIGFVSRTLAPAERNYSQLEREALAIVFGVKRFHSYLYGRHFEIYSDHQPLRHIFSESKGVPTMAASRIQRWALTLSAYEYSIAYRPGKDQAHADALSRLPLAEKPATVPVPGDLLLLKEHLGTVSPLTSQQIKSWTDKDPVLSRVRKFVSHGWPCQEASEELQPYLRRRDELSVLDGCILWGSRVVIPAPGQEAVIQELHETHPGIVRMKSLARSYVWWPNITADLEAKVRSCTKCQASRSTPPMAPLHPWEWPQRPWSRLHLDYAGPFQGRMFLVLVDAHSKWMEVVPVHAATSTVTIEKLRAIFATHGLPERVVTDNGSVFTSADFEYFMQQNGITHVRTAPYHPASNGLAERAVQTFKRGIERLSAGSLETKLSRFLFKYRITPHATTGRSPSELLLGRQPRSRLDLLHPDTAARVQERQARQKYGHDKHTRARAFQVGDRVYVRNFTGTPTWIPGTIQDQTGPVSFRVQLSGGRIRKRHVDHMRIHYPDEDTTCRGSELLEGPGFSSVTPCGREPTLSSRVVSQETGTTHGGLNAPCTTQGHSEAVQPTPALRRSDRIRKPPDRLV